MFLVADKVFLDLLLCCIEGRLESYLHLLLGLPYPLIDSGHQTNILVIVSRGTTITYRNRPGLYLPQQQFCRVRIL